MVIKRLFQGLARTRERIASGLSRLFAGGRRLDRGLLDELEEVLLAADMGSCASAVTADLEQAWRKGELREAAELRPHLRRLLLGRLDAGTAELARATAGPTVVLVAGVNGSGKTTTVAKLAWRLRRQGSSVCLAAADTFRAAAVEQLAAWADRVGADMVRQAHGADPAAVAFDAVERALSRGLHYVLVDTAGRLHTHKGLMEELGKVVRVVRRRIPEAPHETLLVLDATTGQNAVRQAEEFASVVPVTALVLAKLDGTAKGGALFGIREKLALPVKFVGVGETPEDLLPFSPEEFVDALLAVEPADEPTGAQSP